MKRRLNVPLILALIGSGLSFVLGLVGLIYLSKYRNFFAFYKEYLGQEFEAGQTIEQYILTLFPSITVANLRTIIYSYFVASSVLSVVMCIPAIIFAILCFKDNENSVEEFQARNKLHIWLLVSIGLAYLGNGYEMCSLVFEELGIISIGAVVVLIIAFIKIIKVMRLNSYAFKLSQIRKAQEEKQEQDRYSYDQSRFEPASNEGNQIGEENLDKPVINEEPTVDQSKLDEMYELLSKLEKSYKENNISKEDYERMKKTILDNYLK